MATHHSESLAVARVWSDALLELAASQGTEDALLAELEGLVELFDRQPAFETFLTGPVPAKAKREAIERLLRGRASDLLVDTLQVLGRKKRLEITRQVVATYREAWLKLRGRVPVEVVTAAPLTEAQRQDLQRAADRLTHKTAEISERVDPDLLGGMILRFADQRFDTSLATELGLLGEVFLERASRELQSGNLAHDGLDTPDRTT